MKEPLGDYILHKLRTRRILPLLRRFPQCKLLDIGCGWDAGLLRTVEPYIDSGVGIDVKAPELSSAKLKTISAVIDDTLPFDDNSFDVVTIMAVLEHLEKPSEILREVRRVLKKPKCGPCADGGILIGTVPSKAAKPFLEFLSYKLRIITEAEIRDHKRYFNRRDLMEVLSDAGFVEVTHRYFQFGMNNFFVAR